MRPLIPVLLPILLVVALAAGPAAAQGRGDHRQTLADLAMVLGESHALRQACAGPQDQFWRGRMLRLLEVEAPGPDLERELKDAFNAGYAERQAAFAACTPRARQAEAAAAARGRVLAGRLRPAARPAPAPAPGADSDAMAEDARTR